MRHVKKENHVIRKGAILTFKTPYNGKLQILIDKVKKKGDTYSLQDRFGFSLPFMKKSEIIDLFDWEHMGEMHGRVYE